MYSRLSVSLNRQGLVPAPQEVWGEAVGDQGLVIESGDILKIYIQKASV
jgi:hypothetical protein